MLEMFGSGRGGVFPEIYSTKAHCFQRKARQSLNLWVVTSGNNRLTGWKMHKYLEVVYWKLFSDYNNRKWPTFTNRKCSRRPEWEETTNKKVVGIFCPTHHGLGKRFPLWDLYWIRRVVVIDKSFAKKFLQREWFQESRLLNARWALPSKIWPSELCSF